MDDDLATTITHMPDTQLMLLLGMMAARHPDELRALIRDSDEVMRSGGVEQALRDHRVAGRELSRALVRGRLGHTIDSLRARRRKP